MMRKYHRARLPALLARKARDVFAAMTISKVITNGACVTRITSHRPASRAVPSRLPDAFQQKQPAAKFGSMTNFRPPICRRNWSVRINVRPSFSVGHDLLVCNRPSARCSDRRMPTIA